MKKKIKVNIVILGCVLLVAGCISSNNDTIEDPIAIYSIIKEDTSTGIDMVSISGTNPIEVRKKIAEYEIPEVSFEANRKVFYSILDTLYRLKNTAGQKQSVYNTIDSFNYIGIHYLKNILKDKKSISYPLKHKLLKRVSSYDKAITVYSWEENLGTNIRTNICVFQYIGNDGNLYAVFNIDNDNEKDFNFSRSQIMALYKLSSESGSPIYLANFMGDYGRKNHFQGSMILEIRNEDLYFDYDGFGGDTKYFFMNYTEGEMLTTSFSYQKKELKYTFKSLNTIVETRFIFNGQIFERQIN